MAHIQEIKREKKPFVGNTVASKKQEKKLMILDTNVIIDDITTLVALYSGGDNQLYLPNVVFKELDTKKNHRDYAVAYGAREFARVMESPKILETWWEIGKVKNKKVFEDLIMKMEVSIYGQKVVIHSVARSEYRVDIPYEKRREGFPENQNDQRILEIAEDYKGVVISNDKYMLINSLISGIEIQSVRYGSVQEDVTKIPVIRKFSITEELSQKFGEDNYLMPGDIPGFIDAELSEYTPIVLKNGYDINCVYEKGKIIPLDESLWEKSLIQPLNREQKYYMYQLLHPDIRVVVAQGVAGSGKNLLYLAAMIVLFQNNTIQQIGYGRSPVAVDDNQSDMGYRKGGMDQKLGVYHAPWEDAKRDIAIAFLKKESKSKNKQSSKDSIFFDDEVVQKKVEEIEENFKMYTIDFSTMRGSKIRGGGFQMDEAQNNPKSLAAMLMTRIEDQPGNMPKIVITGDNNQIDHAYLNEKNNMLAITFSECLKSHKYAVSSLNKTYRGGVAEDFAQIFANLGKRS